MLKDEERDNLRAYDVRELEESGTGGVRPGDGDVKVPCILYQLKHSLDCLEQKLDEFPSSATL